MATALAALAAHAVDVLVVLPRTLSTLADAAWLVAASEADYYTYLGQLIVVMLLGTVDCSDTLTYLGRFIAVIHLPTWYCLLQ